MAGAATAPPASTAAPSQLVGREGVVVAFDRGEGKVEVDGVPWPARLEAMSPVPAPGDRVRILAADGIVVWVKPV